MLMVSFEKIISLPTKSYFKNSYKLFDIRVEYWKILKDVLCKKKFLPLLLLLQPLCMYLFILYTHWINNFFGLIIMIR